MKIYLTRHSKTIWNEEMRLQGWQDSPLTSQGKEDALALKKHIQNIHIDCIYSSPILRAKETSKIIFDNRKIIYDDRLKEMNFGTYEGRYIKDINQDELYYQLWHQPDDDVCLPEGETYKDVQKRVLSFIYEVYQKHSQDTIFLTIHGMLFVIFNGLMQGLKTSQLNQINTNIVRGCSLSLVEYDGQSFQIDYIGDDSFLKAQKDKIVYK